MSEKIPAFLCLVIAVLVLCAPSYSQTTASCYDHFKKGPFQFSLGTRKVGIGLGGFQKYNGINLAIQDKTCKLNGLGISLIGQPNTKKKTCGAELGLLHNVNNINGFYAGGVVGIVNYVSNGISLAGLIGDFGTVHGVNFIGGLGLVDEVQGISVAGLYTSVLCHQGIGISVGGQVIDSCSGFYLTGLFYKSNFTNGISAAPININAKGNGFQLGAVNYARQYNGVQFGLLNIIDENPRIFGILPLINMNFSKNPPESVEKYKGPVRQLLSFYPGGALKEMTVFDNKDDIYHYESYYENGKVQQMRYYSTDTVFEYTFHRNGARKSTIKYLYGTPVHDYWVYDKRGNKKQLREKDRYYPKTLFESIRLHVGGLGNLFVRE